MIGVVTESEKKRFWEKVFIPDGENACWEWLASKSFDGYGKIYYKGMGTSAHRVSWMIANGSIPGKLCVLHHCDNPECCNPKHLFLGTRGDNVHDAMKKGRRADMRGENAGSSKLTANQVLAIREEYKTMEVKSQNALARKYGVTQANIWYILHRKSWTHI